MITKLDKIASKYAQAYVNVYTDEITADSCQNFLSMANFMRENKRFCAYLDMPNLSFHEKQRFITKLAEAFKLTKGQYKLLSLMLINKQIDLINLVIQKIVDLFHRCNGIVELHVYTSHNVEEQQKDRILQFIKDKFKINAIVAFSVSKKLICGIKIKGAAFVWEKSIMKYLSDIKNKDILRV